MSADHPALAPTPRSCRRGSWFGIFGPQTMVLLPPSEKHRVGRLWEAVDDGAGFDQVLDLLVSAGLSELPGFVLVCETDVATRVVVRGPATVRLTTDAEVIELDGSESLTWVERDLPAVRGVIVELEPADTEDHVLVEGLARVGRVDVPAAGSGTAQPLPEAQPLRETRPVPEVTPVPTPPPPPPSAIDHDGMTQSGGAPTQGIPVPQPGIPGQPQAPGVTARPVAGLVLSTGETIAVDRAIVVGRAPEARRFAAGQQPRLLTVPSPQQEISSTHLEIRPGSGVDHGSAVVTDMGSTNGTVLVQPGLPPEDLQPGIAIQLIPGAIIDLGDGVTIQVTNP